MASTAVDKSRIAPAWKLFDEGDKLAARRVAEKVLAENPTEKERKDAEELLSRLKTPHFAFIIAAVVAVAAIILALVARSLLE